MSAPFDPTKLDLDINNVDKTSINSEENNSSKKIRDTQDDILESIDTMESKDILDSNSGKDKSIPQEEEIIEVEKKEISKEIDLLDQIPEKNAQNNTEDVNTEETLSGDTDDSVGASNKKLIDINISSLQDIIILVDEKEYDYVIIEPEDMQVKVTFKQDNIDRDIRYIKYPIYTNILFKLKQVAGLYVEDTGETQEGKGSLKIEGKVFDVNTKTAPGQNGERVWLKSKENISEKGKKKVKKTSLSMIFAFLGSILFVSLILGGAFIAFIVMNAKTVEDVRFFASLGINLNDINTFISQVVFLIFFILLFICTAALSFTLFRFFYTKKIFKRKKIIYALLSGLLLILTFATGSAWMIIDQKIKSLPNWQEQAYGDLKIFDNSLLISEEFTGVQALINETENLIGPMTLTFDLENFQNNQARKGLTIKKYIWDFGGEVIESFSPTIIKTFDTKGNYEISVTAVGEDLQNEEVTQEISNIPAISISHTVDIEETLTSNGGKKLSFDANDLKNLGRIEWYFKQAISDENPNPTYTDWTRIDEGYEFIPGKIFFDEVFVGLSILNGEKSDANIDKIIVISPDRNSEISGNISYAQDIEDELSFTFFIQDPSTSFGNGFIESYQWTIEEKTYSTDGDFNNTNTSPEIEHVFKTFGEHEIEVTLSNSKGKEETLTRTISIQKSVQLRSPLVILDRNDEEIVGIRYEAKAHEYYIDAFGIPDELKLDARYVRPINILYSLQDVAWDIGNNGNIDARGKSLVHEVPTEGNHTIVADYHFVHRKNPEDTIDLKEYIYVEGIKKEAILNLKIEKDSNYAPIIVRFDASNSFIKNDDIIKFNYDYGDGVSEERDAINPGHKYTKSGDYTVTLTVVGNTGKTYSIEKKLILLPPPQEVKISTSLKKAPIGQGIDFSSAESAGQIVEYFWEFGDGNFSTEANPTYSYSKVGNYKVKLQVGFANNNSIVDETEIEIFEEK